MSEFFRKHKQKVIYFTTVVFAIIFLMVSHRVTTKGEQVFGKFAGAPVERGKVTEILYDERSDFGFGSEVQRHFLATVTRGENKGEEIRARQVTDTLYAVPIKDVEVGDRIMLVYTPFGAEETWVFQEYDRSGPLIMLLLIFFALLLLFGGKKGVSTMISLSLTFACVFYYFVPTILSGYNIYFATIVTCVFIVAVTLILVNGYNVRSFAAAVGCFGGLAVSGILFFVMDHFLMLTGMMDEDSVYLTLMGIPFDLKAIIFSAVVIGVLGGVLDVAVSIVSALNEIYPAGQQHQFRQVVTSGMNIGRDIMATMTNTLILVYIGSALSITLLLTVYSNSFFELINREAITVEILLALLGSMGLLFTIPLSTFFYAFAASKEVPPPVKRLKLADPEPLVSRALPEELKSSLKKEDTPS